MSAESNIAGRLASIDKGIAAAFDDALEAADEGDASLTFVRTGEAVALELRALRLAVLASAGERVRWWW